MDDRLLSRKVHTCYDIDYVQYDSCDHSGMFVLYDSTNHFFSQLMRAKDAQKHGSGEDRSGYYKRLKYFTLSSIKKLFNSKRLNASIPDSFIYVRGDESSHFRERGKKADRKKKYPA